MNLSRIMAALSQRQARQQAHGARAAHPYARLAKAMATHAPRAGATGGKDTAALRAQYLPSPLELAQYGSSGEAHSYNGSNSAHAGGFQSDAFDSGGFQT